MPKDALTGPYAQQQKMLLYVLPVVFAVGGIAFPIGVLLYWTTSNLWTMGQQFYVIRNNPAPAPRRRGSRPSATPRRPRARPRPTVGRRTPRRRTTTAGRSGATADRRPAAAAAARSGSRKRQRQANRGGPSATATVPSGDHDAARTTRGTDRCSERARQTRGSEVDDRHRRGRRGHRSADEATRWTTEGWRTPTRPADADPRTSPASEDADAARGRPARGRGRHRGRLPRGAARHRGPRRRPGHGRRGRPRGGLDRRRRPEPARGQRRRGAGGAPGADPAGGLPRDRRALAADAGHLRATAPTSVPQLEELAEETVAQVKETGEPAPLDPMTPFERKVVHDAVAAAGLSSESEGVEPRRFVVVLPRRDARSMTDVSRETRPPTPEVARRAFSSGAAAAGASGTPRCWRPTGVMRGLIGPREAPRLWDRHLLNCVAARAAGPRGVARGRPRVGCRPARGWSWRSAGPT